MGKECKGGGIHPVSQERRHGGGKQGRVSVTGSPASGGMHSLIGAIDPPVSLCYFSGWPTRECVFPIPENSKPIPLPPRLFQHSPTIIFQFLPYYKKVFV